jgi:hypothetical protein
LNDKLVKIVKYSLDRLGERSTWEGIGFTVALTGSHFGRGLDWGMAAGLAGAVSAGIKAFFPDKK